MYIYVLEAECGFLYVGITKNLEKRYKQHLKGLCTSTKNYSNLKIIHYWNSSTYSEASRFERWCHKNLSSVIELILDVPLWGRLTKELALTQPLTLIELQKDSNHGIS